jgi:hypothetical protein
MIIPYTIPELLFVLGGTAIKDTQAAVTKTLKVIFWSMEMTRLDG